VKAPCRSARVPNQSWSMAKTSKKRYLGTSRRVLAFTLARPRSGFLESCTILPYVWSQNIKAKSFHILFPSRLQEMGEYNKNTFAVCILAIGKTGKTSTTSTTTWIENPKVRYCWFNDLSKLGRSGTKMPILRTDSTKWNPCHDCRGVNHVKSI